ncbi:MAG: hypothetical protein CMM87_03230 [Rickettsiales bacterium]|nr:hypothetical protein [Rickettsiales bacterium]|tara:strand:- start:14551 stop:15465 length:915 start_codon:yes stop_codon:yes gene_type:complete
MKILITGSSGYVASNLISSLKYEKIDIHTVSSTKRDVSKKHFFIKKNASQKLWDNLLESNSFDCIVHLAAQVPDSSIANDKHTYFHANYENTKKIADAAFKAGVKKFIFMSSVFVHGNSSNFGPIKEDDPFDPKNFYAESKAMAEKYLIKNFFHSKMKVIIIRTPMIYGKGAGGNWGALIKLAKSPLPVPFKNFKKNKRNFLYIENLVDFIKYIITNQVKSNTYLVADHCTLSTQSFFTLIRQAFSKPARSFYFPFLNFFLRNLNKSTYLKLSSSLEISTKKATKELNWKPKYQTAEAIKKSLL